MAVAAALSYTVSVVLVKLSSNGSGMSAMSILALTNLGLMFLGLPALLLAGEPPALAELWKPLAVGIFFALANYTTFICAHYGEVSLMTPVMGVKILFVFATVAVMDGIWPAPTVFTAGIICCAAVFLMGFDKSAFKSHKAGKTLALALITCLFYAVCDVLVQKLSAGFGVFEFLGLVGIVLALSSAPFIPKMVREISAWKPATKTSLAAAVFMVGDCLLMFAALAEGLDAGMCNILYNTRGVISVALVCVLSHKYTELEHLSKGSAARRFAGSAMILAAVAMAFA